MGLTGEDGDVVLVGLVQGVVHNAVLVGKTFEDVHTHLQACVCTFMCARMHPLIHMCR